MKLKVKRKAKRKGEMKLKVKRKAKRKGEMKLKVKRKRKGKGKGKMKLKIKIKKKIKIKIKRKRKRNRQGKINNRRSSRYYTHIPCHPQWFYLKTLHFIYFLFFKDVIWALKGSQHD